MKVCRDIDSLDTAYPVITTGMFDGVHRGHQKILNRLKQAASEFKAAPVILTFWPHPRMVIYPQEETKLLTTLEEKLDIFENTGIKHTIVQPFTRELSVLGSDEFVEQVLMKKLQVKCLVYGYDHRFGSKKKNENIVIQEIAERYGFDAIRVDELNVEGVNISSSKIRNALYAGNVSKAAGYLGYKYFINGTVEGGMKLGTRIGFPTANISNIDEHKLIPCKGVYAVKVYVNNRLHKGMMNIGTRPTIDKSNTQTSLEVHIFDFNKNLYDKPIRVEFVDRIRAEQKFNSLSELKNRLADDKTTALKLLA